jgi:hypothetical protein
MHNENSSSGYKMPPRNSRFAKGKSGNPKGRPRKKLSGASDILDRELPMDVNGELINVPMEEAALILLFRSGLKGNSRAAQEFLKHSKRMGIAEVASEPFPPIVRIVLYPEVCDSLLLALGAMSKGGRDFKPGTDREIDRTALRMELWVLEEALKRRKLTKITAGSLNEIARSSVDPDQAVKILALAGYTNILGPAQPDNASTVPQTNLRRA